MWLQRRLLILLSIGLYAVVFTSFVLFEKPGLGLGHFFYIPVALLALAGGARFGLLGGFLATALYTLAIAATPRVPTGDVMTLATVIRLVTYSACGALVGWFASQHRRHLGQLRELADRDFLTGLLNARVFDDTLAERCHEGERFLLLLGDMDDLKEINDTHGHTTGNKELRRLADALLAGTDPADEVARVGGDEFAVVTQRRRAAGSRHVRPATRRARGARPARQLRLGNLPRRRGRPGGAVSQGRRSSLRRQADPAEPPRRRAADASGAAPLGSN